MRKIIYSLIVFMLTFYACSDNSTDPAGNGSIKMYMFDSPALYDSVVVVVNRVEVHTANGDDNSGWFVINNNVQVYDLLQLRNGANVILGDTALPAGHYTQIRLILGNGSYIVQNGLKFDLTVPSGLQTGIKLNHEFNIEEGTLYELSLDFDASRSIHVTGSGKYMMQPTIRVVPLLASGSISGNIVPDSANSLVWTSIGLDTISTSTDVTGYFKLMGLPESSYDVHIDPVDPNYTDTTQVRIKVTSNENVDLGNISLSKK